MAAKLGYLNLSLALVAFGTIGGVPVLPPGVGCSLCPRGYGVTSLCDDTQDTVCSSCPEGLFSAISSPEEICIPCTPACEEGMFILHLCSPSTDTVCQQCSQESLPEHEGYVKQCLTDGEEPSTEPNVPDIEPLVGPTEEIIYVTLPLPDDYEMPGEDAVEEGEEGEVESVEEDKDGEDEEESDEEEKEEEEEGEDEPEPDEDEGDEQEEKDEENQEEMEPEGEGEWEEVGQDIQEGDFNDATEEMVDPDLGEETTDEYREDGFLPGWGAPEVTQPSSDLDPAGFTAGEEDGTTEGVSDGSGEEDGSGWVDFEVLKTTPRKVETTTNPYRYTRRKWMPFWQKTTPTTTTTTTTRRTPRPWKIVPTPKKTTTTTTTTTIPPTTTGALLTSVLAVETTSQASTTTPEATTPSPATSSTTTPTVPPTTTTTVVTTQTTSSTTKPETTTPSNKTAFGILGAEDPIIGETKKETSSKFPIIMAAVTSGIIFFALGFFLNGFKRRKAGYSPDQTLDESYPKPQDNHYQMVPVSALREKAPRPRRSHPTAGGEGSPGEKKRLYPVPGENEEGEDSDQSEAPPYGSAQSPVDINPNKADTDATLEKTPLSFHYPSPGGTCILRNNGSDVTIDEHSTGSVLSGGPFGEKRFCLNNIVFRWGSSDSRGSEHSINGKRYSGEIQLIHWNSDDYVSYQEASESEDGLAALAVFIKVDGDDNEALLLVTDCLQSIQYKEEARELPDGFNPAKLLPENRDDYWTYQGSLTKPPHRETVTWVVFKDHVTISYDQMSEFRRLVKYQKNEAQKYLKRNEGYILDNFRDTQPLKDRTIRVSFV